MTTTNFKTNIAREINCGIKDIKKVNTALFSILR